MKRLALLALAFALAGAAWIAVLRESGSAPGSVDGLAATEPAPALVSIELAPPPSVRARAAEAAAAKGKSPADPASPDARLVVRVFVSSSVSHPSALVDLPIELVLAPAGRAFEAEPILSTATDTEGRAVFEVPWSVVEAARAEHRDVRLHARLRASGWQRRADDLELPRTPGVRELALHVARGGTVLGRVVDAQGRGVPGRITVSGSPGVAAATTSEHTEAREDGAFAVDLRTPGLHDFLADAGDHGTAGLARHDIVLGEPPMPEIVLTVSGPGRLVGRLVDARGEPAAGVELRAELVSVRDERGVSLGGDARFDLSGGGRVRANCTTAADGTFDLRGLRLDHYRLLAGPWRVDAARVDLSPEGLLADGTPLELVFSRPHLVVRCVDADGAPIPAEHAPLPHDRSRDGPGWPENPRIRVDRLEPGPAPLGISAGGGVSVYEVEAGLAYRVTLSGGAFASSSLRVDVPADAMRIEVVLACLPSANGWLAVEARNAAGELLERGWTVRVEDPDSDALVLSVVGEFASERSPLALPAGRWRVVVDGYEPRDFPPGALGRPRVGGRTESIADVLPGATTRVQAWIGVGARLRVQIAGQVPRDEPTGAERTVHGVEFDSPDGRHAVAFTSRPVTRFATLHLRDGTRAAIPVRFFSGVAPSFHAQWDAPPLLEIGTEDVSEPLPAGRYVLEAVHPDGRVARAPVVLVEGRTTDVVLAFE